MLMLNKTASRAAVSAGSKSATDVTGFGLLGHALNMAGRSKVNLIIHNDRVPLMNKVKELSTAGAVPKGAKNNLEFCAKKSEFSENITDGDKLALSDPQTSGGLLIAVPQKGLKKFERIMKKEKQPYWVKLQISDFRLTDFKRWKDTMRFRMGGISIIFYFFNL